MCSLAVLVRTRVLILASLVSERVWILHSLELISFAEKGYFFHHYR